jgi:hypothetical protein
MLRGDGGGTEGGRRGGGGDQIHSHACRLCAAGHPATRQQLGLWGLCVGVCGTVPEEAVGLCCPHQRQGAFIRCVAERAFVWAHLCACVRVCGLLASAYASVCLLRLLWMALFLLRRVVDDLTCFSAAPVHCIQGKKSSSDIQFKTLKLADWYTRTCTRTRTRTRTRRTPHPHADRSIRCKSVVCRELVC